MYGKGTAEEFVEATEPREPSSKVWNDQIINPSFAVFSANYQGLNDSYPLRILLLWRREFRSLRKELIVNLGAERKTEPDIAPNSGVNGLQKCSTSAEQLLLFHTSH
ncbi:hypothetical protein BTUL_0095g00030 [Botrytis tulipae]|uniref:Uncharacterized protein n=1 Tax=Botrytis tulipae TaxID=87230 RepID=A0A4Z1EI08_9HELO|nr:hypothetical protein BTUL_0095g00030 [Botrytis tulipae]